jgi:hypothetical protein
MPGRELKMPFITPREEHEIGVAVPSALVQSPRLWFSACTGLAMLGAGR